MNLFNRKILIVDADEGFSAPLCRYFGQIGYICRAANTLGQGRSLLARERFDAVIADFFLPDGKATDLFDGGEIPPVIVCSAAVGDEEVLEALSSGAADYVFKPCSPRVMAARLELRLPPQSDSVSRHGLLLNADLRTVFYRGEPVKLTSSEFNILRFLMENPGKFFTADEIYENVWNASSMQTSVVRFHISNLKKALFAATGKNPILSEFGVGYAFAPER